MDFRVKDYWALILGGSSGFGLATAKKLASHGMNLCIVHRDRRGSMERVEEEFASIRASVKLLAFNVDGLSDEGRKEALDGLAKAMAPDGRVRLLLHSIAFGNLKLLTPENSKEKKQDSSAKLAARLGVSSEKVRDAVNSLFSEEGCSEFMNLADAPHYEQEVVLDAEDMSRTIYAMGTSLLTWVGDVYKRGLFAADARVIGMTSEGNEVAWKGYAAVSAAKVSLESLSRSIAVEYAPQLRSNIVQAGVTDTPALRLIPGSSHILAAKRLRNPMGRTTKPEDVAGVIALLCTDEAAWINGTIVRVDGGERIAG